VLHAAVGDQHPLAPLDHDAQPLTGRTLDPEHPMAPQVEDDPVGTDNQAVTVAGSDVGIKGGIGHNHVATAHMAGAGRRHQRGE
jgi:hypothetical protein